MALTSPIIGLLMCLTMCISMTNGVLVDGPCPQLTSKLDFDAQPYQGKWYDFEQFPSLDEEGDSCTAVDYILQQDGSIRIDFLHNKDNDGVMTIPDKSKPGEFDFYFDEGLPGAKPMKLFVTDTDYNTYAVEFSCEPVGESQSRQHFWFLTRKRGVAPANLNDLKTTYQTKGLDLSNIHRVNQNNCT